MFSLNLSCGIYRAFRFSVTVGRRASSKSFGSFDWLGRPTRETRREVLRRQLLKHGLEIVRPIGSGTFGRVVLAKDTSLQQLFAVKIQKINQNDLTQEQSLTARQELIGLDDYSRGLSADGLVRTHLEETIKDLQNEINHADPASGNIRWFNGQLVRRAVAEAEIMRSLDHPFVCKLHSTFEEMDRLFMVLTFIPGGTLKAFARQCGGILDLYQAQFCVAEIVLALAYLREQNIAHRDLKPENILLNADGHIQLIDFGLATQKRESLKVFCGTAEYIAPEVLTKQSWSADLLDWWALGVTVYQLLTGRLPFAGKTTQEVFLSIMMDQVRFPPDFPEPAQRFVADLLCTNPSNRLSPPKIFGHPFFEGIDWKAIADKQILSPLQQDRWQRDRGPVRQASKTLYLPP